MDKLPSPPEEPQSTPEKHLQDRTPWPNGKVPKNLCVRLQILASKVVISKQVDDYDESLSNDLYSVIAYFVPAEIKGIYQIRFNIIYEFCILIFHGAFFYIDYF